MDPFTLHLSTKLHFGQGVIKRVGIESRQWAEAGPVMVLTGGGSVHKNGVYGRVAGSLKAAGVPFFEQSGVQPNPRLSSIHQGIESCRREGVNLVLAVGGGSTVDAAKAIAIGTKYKGDVWDLFTGRRRCKQALAVGAVLTLSATGSEYNGNTVISKWDDRLKLYIADDILRPRFSVLDPETTVTVPPQQSAAGVADIFSHLLEQYFSPTRAPVQDGVAEALLAICRDRGPVTVDHGDNVEARADIMWASSLALCGLTGAGKITDWSTHVIEHELSARYDLTHGIGLAILTPSWMKQVLDENTAPRLAKFGRVLWALSGEDETSCAAAAIERTRGFIESLGLPSTLSEVGIGTEAFEEISQSLTKHGPLGGFRKLDSGDILEILQRVA